MFSPVRIIPFTIGLTATRSLLVHPCYGVVGTHPHGMVLSLLDTIRVNDKDGGWKVQHWLPLVTTDYP